MLFSTLLSVSLPLSAVLVSGAPIGKDIHAWMEMERRAGADDASLAQGLNSFFKTLNIQTPCTAGQKACVNGRLATCSPEENFEVQASCPNGETCLAAPQLTVRDTILIGCTTEDNVLKAIQALGGTGGVAEDRGVTALPSNIEVATSIESVTATATDVPTSTATDSASPTSTETAPATCTTDDDEEPTSIPTFEATVGDPFPTTLADVTSTDEAPAPTCTVDPEDPEEGEDPTETEELPNSTETVDPSATCTEEPEEPIETEEPVSISTLTLILVPNPTAPGEFVTSTFTPTETATETATSTDGTTEIGATETGVTTTLDPLSTSSAVILPIVPSGSSTTITAGIPSPSSDINVIGTSIIPAISSTVPDIVALPVETIPAKAKRQFGSQPGAGVPGAPVITSPLLEAAQSAQFANGVIAAHADTLQPGKGCAVEGAGNCVGGQIGTCVNGVWEVAAGCHQGTQCFWVPNVAVGSGIQMNCLSYDDASSLFSQAGLFNGPFA